MAKKRGNTQRRRKSGGNGGLYKRLYVATLCTLAGVIPKNNMSTAQMARVAGVKIAQIRGDRNHELPNKVSEVVASVTRALGGDDMSVSAALDLMLPETELGLVTNTPAGDMNTLMDTLMERFLRRPDGNSPSIPNNPAVPGGGLDLYGITDLRRYESLGISPEQMLEMASLIL